MLKFSGEKLSKEEMLYLKLAARFTLDKYITKSKQRKIDVDVILIKDKKATWGGECCYLGVEQDRKKFEIRIQKSLVKKAKKIDTRMKDIVATLIHELIHVKQYTNNQLFDYVNGSVRYEGKIYKDTDNFIEYWDSPWEVEAYGRSVGTYEQFRRILKLREKEVAKLNL